MRGALFCILCALASSLEIETQEPQGTNYAYVTMWVNKAGVPAKFFEHTLSKDEMMWLNSAQIDNQGNPMLTGKAPKSTVFLEEEGKPKEEPPKVHMPLRPRNSNYQGILDLATNLRNVGAKYPLVVLTNADEFKDKEVLAEHPNLQVVWLNSTDFLDRKCKIGAGHELHYQKLFIWKLTQFDKLMWMDTDIAFTRNVDYAFKLDTKGGARITTQIDDYHCDGRNWSPTSAGICTGLMLIQPSIQHFTGLMLQQQKMQACWGDQSIISTYFSTGKGKEAKQFQRSVINFARCQKSQGNMDAWHFSGMPGAKRIGDPEGFKRKEDGRLVNMTAIKEQAQEKADKKKAEEEKAKEKKKKGKGKKNVDATKNILSKQDQPKPDLSKQDLPKPEVVDKDPEEVSSELLRMIMKKETEGDQKKETDDVDDSAVAQ